MVGSIYPFSYFFDLCRVLNHLVPEKELAEVNEFLLDCSECKKDFNECSPVNERCEITCPIEIDSFESNDNIYPVYTIMRTIQLFRSGNDLDLFKLETSIYKVLRNYETLKRLKGKKEVMVGGLLL